MTRKPLAVLALGVAVAALTGCGASSANENRDELTFAAIPSEQNVDPVLKYKNLTTLIEKATGKKVTFVRSTDYNAVIEGMVSGKVDIAEFGPLSYVLAKKNGAKITAVASAVEKDAPATYLSYGIVPKDSPITDLKGFKGKTVCFVDPSSTSGFLFPSAGLQAQGLDAKRDVKPVMAGGHDNSALSVKSGKCDAGFAHDGMVDRILVDKGELKKGDLKVVWRSAPIPNDPFAIRDDLPADVRKKITDALVKDANKERLTALGICSSADACDVTSDPAVFGTRPVTDATFDPVRRACEATKNEECS